MSYPKNTNQFTDNDFAEIYPDDQEIDQIIMEENTSPSRPPIFEPGCIFDPIYCEFE